jgi:malonyl-CoA/methylmalonyl-CoA synthetase
MTASLFDCLFASARPDRIALDTAVRTYRYDELGAETARWARALCNLGVRPGDRVAVQVEKSPANLILYLATIRAGGVYLPLNTAYTIPELAYFIGDSEPALVVCDPAVRDAVVSECGAPRVETLDTAGEGSLASAVSAASGDFETVPRGPDDLAAICYTSGTTGRSKGAMLTHRALISNAETLKNLWGFTSDDVLIHALPIYHVHGLFVATNVALMAGASMIFQSRFEPQAVLAALPRATTLMGIPTFYTRLLSHPGLTRDVASRMRLFISGSAPLLEATHREFESRTGHAILERYGMTETGMNASNPYVGQRRPGTVGFALPGVSLRIADPGSGGVLSQGSVGVIEVKGPNVCAGYWRNLDKTTEAFRADGYFITGDLGVIDSDGYLSIVGRDKDLIITGGLNVYPKEVESEIDGAPGVLESAVIGLPHADFGEAVTAVVACGPNRDPALDEAAILSYLAPRLARFKQPKRVIFLPDLPRNAMGKVQKAKLRDDWRCLYDQ